MQNKSVWKCHRSLIYCWVEHVPVLESKAIAPKTFTRKVREPKRKVESGGAALRARVSLTHSVPASLQCAFVEFHRELCQCARCAKSDGAGRPDEGVAAAAGRGAVRAVGGADGAPPPLRQGGQKQTQTRHLHHSQQQPHMRRRQQQILGIFFILYIKMMGVVANN